MKLARTLGVLAALAAAACSGDDDSDHNGATSDEKGALYMVATAFYTSDQVETYLTTTDSFDADTKVSVTSGTKLLGEVVPIVSDGKVYVTDEADPALIKRFEVDGRDRLAQTGELSFAGMGVTSIASWFVYFIDSEKAYLFDQAGHRIIVWNPKQMKLTGKVIELKQAERDGWLPRLALELFSVQRRGDQLLVPTAWVGQDDEYRYASGLTILDTKRDEVVAVAEDERCGEAYMSVKSKAGDYYFFPSGHSGAQHFFADGHDATCVLRVRADANAFDPDFALDLSAAGNGQAAASGVPDGDNGFFFGAADKALFEDRDNNAGAYWKVYHYDFASEKAEPVASMPLWSGTLYAVPVADELYLPYYTQTDDGSTTTLYRVQGGLEELFSFDASWGGFGRLR
jgi:hypothetical protein